MTTDNFYLQNRLSQTSKTGGQQYSDTSPFSIPWYKSYKQHWLKQTSLKRLFEQKSYKQTFVRTKILQTFVRTQVIQTTVARTKIIQKQVF